MPTITQLYDLTPEAGRHSNYMRTVSDQALSPQLVLSFVKRNRALVTSCRVGVCEVKDGRPKAQLTWLIERYPNLRATPAGAYVEWLPATPAQPDRVDDLQLPPWVAVYREKA